MSTYTSNCDIKFFNVSLILNAWMILLTYFNGVLWEISTGNNKNGKYQKIKCQKCKIQGRRKYRKWHQCSKKKYIFIYPRNKYF